MKVQLYCIKVIKYKSAMQGWRSEVIPKAVKVLLYSPGEYRPRDLTKFNNPTFDIKKVLESIDASRLIRFSQRIPMQMSRWTLHMRRLDHIIPKTVLDGYSDLPSSSCIVQLLRITTINQHLLWSNLIHLLQPQHIPVTPPVVNPGCFALVCPSARRDRIPQWESRDSSWNIQWLAWRLKLGREGSLHFKSNVADVTPSDDGPSERFDKHPSWEPTCWWPSTQDRGLWYKDNRHPSNWCTQMIILKGGEIINAQERNTMTFVAEVFVDHAALVSGLKIIIPGCFPKRYSVCTATGYNAMS